MPFRRQNAKKRMSWNVLVVNCRELRRWCWLGMAMRMRPCRIHNFCPFWSLFDCQNHTFMWLTSTERTQRPVGNWKIRVGITLNGWKTGIFYYLMWLIATWGASCRHDSASPKTGAWPSLVPTSSLTTPIWYHSVPNSNYCATALNQCLHSLHVGKVPVIRCSWTIKTRRPVMLGERCLLAKVLHHRHLQHSCAWLGTVSFELWSPLVK